MTLEGFEIALHAFCRRSRFRPFWVELVSGERFQIDHPEAIALRGLVAFYVSPEGSNKLFDGSSVSQLFDTPAEST